MVAAEDEMTSDADFKRKVRERMTQTGENYTQARTALLATEPPATGTPPPLSSTEPPASGHPTYGLSSGDPYVDRTVRSFFDGQRLRSIPTRRRPRAAVLMHLLTRFRRGQDYSEPEVNEILRTAHDDVATLRRELVDYRWLERSDGVYRVTEGTPRRSRDEAQEVPTDEADRLDRLPRA